MKTLSQRILLAFIGLVGIIFILFFIGMKFLVEPYYYNQKIHVMKEIVEQMGTIIQVGESPVDIIENLTHLEDQFEGKISFYALVEEEITERVLGKYVQGNVIRAYGSGKDQAFIVETNYPVDQTKWLVYYNRLPGGEVAILQISITAIEKTLKGLQLFVLYLALLILFFASILAVIISENISRPIKALTKMAGEIRQLNFDVQYTDQRKDEIGQLGRTFNKLTRQLNATIRKLTHELNKEKRVDALRKEFVAQVSHELQTPLTVIHGYTEALKDGMATTTQEQENYYDIIHDESEKMSAMIKELLQLSELESDNFSVEKKQIDLKSFFDQLNQDYQQVFGPLGLVLVYIGLKEPIYYEGDRIKLEQAFRNILNNAKKYAYSASTIYFTLQEEGQQVTVVISNEGPKIEEEELGKIFDSFYKGRNSKGREGVGIGLALVARIFKHHGIGYYIENNEKGVVVTVIIKGRGHL